MSKQNFYLHLSSQTLANYLGSAAISPTSYIDNKPKDVQSLAKYGLLLSSKIYAKEDKCSLVIALSENEIKQLKEVSSDYQYLGDWLPISRVRKIYFKDKDQMKQTIFDIKAGTAFVPDSLLFHQIEKENNYAEKVPDLKKVDVKNNLRKNIDFYDRVLGAICFSNIAVSNIRESTINCSPLFLSMCSFYSDSIKKEYLGQGGKIDTKFDEFLVENKKYKDLKEYTYSDLNKRNLEEAFKKFEIGEIPYKLGSINLAELDNTSALFPLAVVSVYGKSGAKKDQDLVSEIYEGKITNRVNGICFTYGLHRGYKNLRNKYKWTQGSSNVKLKLESAFDFVLLESIYNTLTGKKNNPEKVHAKEIEYAKKQLNAKIPFDYEYHNILGRLFVYKKKRNNILTRLMELLNEKISSVFTNELLKFDYTKMNKMVAVEGEKIVHEELNKYKNSYHKILEKKEAQILELQDRIVFLEKKNASIAKDNTVEKNQKKEGIVFEVTNNVKELIPPYQKENVIEKATDPAPTNLFPEPIGTNSKQSMKEVFKKMTQVQKEKHLKKLKVKELQDFCKELEIKVHKKLKKNEIINAIIEEV